MTQNWESNQPNSALHINPLYDGRDGYYINELKCLFNLVVCFMHISHSNIFLNCIHKRLYVYKYTILIVYVKNIFQYDYVVVT